ncbi:hypothetical protein FB00_11255 [Cellulosimicrobium funkei]|uniref:Terminase n=1 Tax=Cellulosimicrobium funkei TaxID=264251 RepID=A0A0H2L355_9MICO|nr:hypothetical protein [Cellulosimicrobium funkei]KLN34577.1 hypothetical protein FB00_11255 [Cellulosimicrobium funkei]
MSTLIAPEFRAIPRYMSAVPDDVPLDAPELGAKHLGLDLKPQGRQVGSLLEARREDGRPLYRRVAIQFARRSTKTTSIASTLLGRCLSTPGYRVISTAQDGSRASTALREIMYILDAVDPDGTLGLWETRWSNGGEMILFSNGSRWERRPPNASAFRGAAADALWFDEAGEYGPEVSDALVQGALPLMDTRQMGQVIISGTPAPSRTGLLWDSIVAAQEGKRGTGALDYGMGEEDDPASEDVWWRCHPGLACGLVDIEIVRERFELMPLPAFMVEYLGYWPKAAHDRAIDPDRWEECAGELALPDTDRFVLAFDVHPQSSSAALVAAWRDKNGVARVSLTEHKPGTNWLAKTANDLLVKYPKARLMYDAVGANLDPARTLERSKVKNRVKPVNSKDVQAGQAAFVRQVHAGDLEHPNQPGLNAAADCLQWRESAERGRWFGFSRSKGDITPVRAAAMALFEFENNTKSSIGVIPNAYT